MAGRGAEPITRRRDVLCFALFVVASLALRLPALDVVGLNPDESQYEAVAAYVVAEGGSEYDRPSTIGAGFTLYRIVTDWFGPYPTAVVRGLVILCDVAAAWLLFAIVAPVAGRFGGVVAGLAFQHWALAFEGYSANREWFTIVPLLAALALATRLVDRGGRRLAAWCLTGLLAGAALWFKVQALGMLVAVPALVVAAAWRDRTWRDVSWRIGAHLAGGLLAGLVYLVPLVTQGVLAPYAEMVASGWSEYAMGGGADSASPGPWRTFEALYFTLPSRGLVTLAYGFVAVLAVVAIRGPGERLSPGTVSRLVALVAFAAGACWSIRLGGRFFAHYFLFLVPAVGALFGLLAGRAFSRVGSGGASTVPLAVLGLYLIERLAAGAMAGTAALRGAPLYVVGMLVVLGVVVWVAPRPHERAWPGLLAAVLVELALLVVPAQLGPRPPSLPNHADRLAGVTAHVRSIAGPQSRLFVWGWLPELYSSTRLVPASHFVITQFVVRDFAPHVELGLDPEIAAELMAELDRTRPEIVVDAAARSWTMAGDDRPVRYEIDRYPELGLRRWLDASYRVTARVDGCVVYRRVAGGGDAP